MYAMPGDPGLENPQIAQAGSALGAPARSISGGADGVVGVGLAAAETASETGAGTVGDAGGDRGDAADDSVQGEAEKHVTDDVADVANGARATAKCASANGAPADEPYSVFSRHKALGAVACATITALFSPLATNIYFPALTDIASDLGVSMELVNLTVTTYMIFQGVSPTFWGSLADLIGRRPVYVLTITVFLLANLGLALEHSYAALLVLRMVQSAGSAATIAIGAGTIADLFPPATRGSYMGVFTSGVMVAPAFAPVVGGALSSSAHGWRMTFWFLLALAGADLAVIVLVMPETGRRIVGNGSVRPSWINTALVDLVRSRHAGKPPAPRSGLTAGMVLRSLNPLRCVRYIVQLDLFFVLIANAAVYTSFYCVTVGAATLLADVYGLSTVMVGVCFLPYGVGSTLGSIVVGRVFDYDYKRTCRETGIEIDRARSDPTFPIEYARLRTTWIFSVVYMCSLLVFGWTFRASVSLAVPLVMLFIGGFTVIASFNATSLLLVDLRPSNASAVSAANNFVRCLCGAGGAAVIDTILRHLGPGWTYTLVAGVATAISGPFLLIVLRFGPGWRQRAAAEP
ncbi:major facilitator superfamily domain-containing protein [Dipodascopsis tothii]|uniref:major facilitator superfamily domain-containing protein n=1 Tax=Dipodascopsis tothii TaxID=44089 RepID=UPI0034CFF5EE